jgi:hypothetical protein
MIEFVIGGLIGAVIGYFWMPICKYIYSEPNKPTIEERIKALEQNQKAMVGQQDRILTIIEKKLRLDAIKKSEQRRDSHGRFRKGGRR